MEIRKGLVRATHFKLAVELSQSLGDAWQARTDPERERTGAQPYAVTGELMPQIGWRELKQFHGVSSKPIRRRLASA